MQPYLSIVVPVYNAADNLEACYTRLSAVLDRIAEPYEIVFVNDGSRDSSAAFLREFHRRRPREVRVIDLNGNFGQDVALLAAFERVRGEVIVTFAPDLQSPPDEIPRLLAAIEAGHDVVGGCRSAQHENLFKRYVSQLLKLLHRSTHQIQIRDPGCMLRAYRRYVVDTMVASGESWPFVPALALSFAVNPIEVEVAVEHRDGAPNHGLYDLVRRNFDLVTGFSTAPLQLFTLFGMLVAAASLLFVTYLFIRRVFVGPDADDVFTLFAILYFLAGIGIVGLGIVGEYVGRIYWEVRRRPRFVIREIIEQIETTEATAAPQPSVSSL